MYKEEKATKGSGFLQLAMGAEWVMVILHKGPYATSNQATDADIMGADGVRTLIAPILSELGVDLYFRVIIIYTPAANQLATAS